MRLYIFMIFLCDPDCVSLDEVYVVFANSFDKARDILRKRVELWKYGNERWIECWEYEVKEGIAERVERWILYKNQWMTEMAYEITRAMEWREKMEEEVKMVNAYRKWLQHSFSSHEGLIEKMNRLIKQVRTQRRANSSSIS